jgi:hypothetical protein
MPRLKRADLQIARSPVNSHEMYFVIRQKMLTIAYRLRKKCAVNAHFSRKDHDSYLDNYFPCGQSDAEFNAKNSTF